MRNDICAVIYCFSLFVHSNRLLAKIVRKQFTHEKQIPIKTYIL